jgi:hygromycin-B 4-O-kinase
MVLRISRYGGDFAKDEAVSAVARGMVPVPAITVRGETGGWAYAVSQRLTGTALDDLDANELAAVVPDLFDVMDAIGRIEVGGDGYGVWGSSRAAPYRSWPEYLLAVEQETPRVPGWRAALAASDTGLEPFERGLVTLRRLARDLPDERRMIHGDDRIVIRADVGTAADVGPSGADLVVILPDGRRRARPAWIGCTCWRRIAVAG